MEDLKLKKETIDKIMQYLFSKPWIEVNPLIVEIDGQIQPQVQLQKDKEKTK